MWTVISIVLTVIALSCAVLALSFNAHTVRVVRESQARLQHSKPLQAESLDARLSELEAALTMLANRVKMQKVRNVITHLETRDKGGEPDAKSDPEAWRAWKNSQLKAGVFNQ